MDPYPLAVKATLQRRGSLRQLCEAVLWPADTATRLPPRIPLRIHLPRPAAAISLQGKATDAGSGSAGLKFRPAGDKGRVLHTTAHALSDVTVRLGDKQRNGAQPCTCESFIADGLCTQDSQQRSTIQESRPGGEQRRSGSQQHELGGVSRQPNGRPLSRGGRGPRDRHLRHELILVPRGAVRQRPGGSPDSGRVYGREEEGTNLLQPVSLHSALPFSQKSRFSIQILTQFWASFLPQWRPHGDCGDSV